MREMLFRGKPKKQSKYIFFSSVWQNFCKDGFVYGSLVIDKDRCFIAVSALCQQNSAINNGITSMVEVIPETVGQYTSLTDKKGKKIFEGDIVKHTQSYDVSGIVTSIGVIKWSDSYGGWLISNYSNGRADMFLANETYRIEVIGNIHDNPELQKGGADNGKK